LSPSLVIHSSIPPILHSFPHTLFIHPASHSFLYTLSIQPTSHSFIHSDTLYSSDSFLHTLFIRPSSHSFIHNLFIHPSIHTKPFIHPSVPPFIHSFIHPLLTLHKMVLQEMMTTTENTARHENTTKLGLKTTDKSCKAALLNEKLCVLDDDDDDDDAAVPLGCSPLLTSATKIEAPSLSLEELDVSAQHLQPAASNNYNNIHGKNKIQHNRRKSQKFFLHQQQPWTVNDPNCKVSLSLSLSLSLGFFSLRYDNKSEPDKNFFLLASFLPHRVRTVASGRLRRWRQ